MGGVVDIPRQVRMTRVRIKGNMERWNILSLQPVGLAGLGLADDQANNEKNKKNRNQIKKSVHF